jgi:hypothetical protein
MKRMKLHHLTLLARWLTTAFVLALAACQQDDAPATSAESPVRLQVKAGIAQRQAADTRVWLNEYGDGDFEDGDEIIVTRQSDGLKTFYRYEYRNWMPFYDPELNNDEQLTEEERRELTEGFILHQSEETFTAYYANPDNPVDPLTANAIVTMDNPEVTFTFFHQSAKFILIFQGCHGYTYSIVGLGEQYESPTYVENDDEETTVYANPTNVSSFAIDLNTGGGVTRHIISLANVESNWTYVYYVSC